MMSVLKEARVSGCGGKFQSPAMIFRRNSTTTEVIGTLQTVPPKRPVQAGPELSVIGADLVVKGSLTSKHDIQIDGNVDGDVRCAKLDVGSSGQIVGNIFAGDVTIHGTLKGNIWANKVLLCSGSRVDGDVVNRTFGIESGAFFEGNSHQSDDPIAEATAKAIKKVL
jgi:cytoskeletal protein CcmA (bactofilin family)